MTHRRSGKTGDRRPAEGLDELPQVLRNEGAFLPKPLKETAMLGRDTYTLLAETQADLTRLDEAVHRSPAGPALVTVTRVLEVQGAAELSGVFASLREIFLLEVPNPTAPTVDERLRRYLDSYRAAVVLTRSGRAVDLPLLNDIDAISTGAPLGGAIRWRVRPRWVGGPDPADACLIAAPPGRSMMARTMKCLEWMDSHPVMPLVGKLAVLNAQLAALSPLAGMDQLAELYVVLQLIRHRVLRDQILPLSNWVTSNRDSYRAHLRGYADGELDSWVVFFADGIRQVCRDQMRLIAVLEDIREQHLSEYTREDKFLDLVGGLVGRPVTNRHLIAKDLNISLDHAGALADRLVHEGLATILELPSRLQQTDGKRYATVVYCPEILELLSLHLPLPPEEDSVFAE